MRLNPTTDQIIFMIFQQMLMGDMKNFTYIIGDEKEKVAAVVDAGKATDKIIRAVESEGLKIIYIISTHSHFDHVWGNESLASRTGGKIVAHSNFPHRKDISVDEDDIVEVGSVKIKILYAPGHTEDSICLLVDGKLTTGDVLFVGNCGRIDLPGGDGDKMKVTLKRLMGLDDDIEVWPGHDYADRKYSTIGDEKRSNVCFREIA